MLRSRTWNLTGALVLFGFAATCGWFGLYHDPGAVDRPGDLIGWGAGAALCVAGAIRVLMVGVIATAERLTVRELLSTTKLPWPWLSHVDVRAKEMTRPGLLRTTLYNPTIHYMVPGRRTKHMVTVTALGAHRHKVAQAWADHLNELIQHHKRPDDVGRKTE